ncbi:MAG: hypothetical protein U1F83_02370 [Verrucomicrobiota bacterium]
MLKWVKFIIAVSLPPVCVGAGKTLWMVMSWCGSGHDVDSDCGRARAGSQFLLLPKPMWIYVVGHELTHAIWVWLFGGSVKKFKASSSGGHVIVDKNNFLISLSPYFFPFYVVLVVLIFLVGHLIWNWKISSSGFIYWLSRLRLSRHPHRAHSQDAAIGYHQPGLPVFRRGDLPRQRAGVAHRPSVAHSQGGFADDARLVA